MVHAQCPGLARRAHRRGVGTGSGAPGQRAHQRGIAAEVGGGHHRAAAHAGDACRNRLRCTGLAREDRPSRIRCGGLHRRVTREDRCDPVGHRFPPCPPAFARPEAAHRGRRHPAGGRGRGGRGAGVVLRRLWRIGLDAGRYPRRAEGRAGGCTLRAADAGERNAAGGLGEYRWRALP